MNISAWSTFWAAHAGDKPALICDDSEISYRAFDRSILGIAGALRRRYSLTPGDRVAFLGANCPDMLALSLACARLGAMIVPLNWRLAAPEHACILGHSGARLLVCEPDFALRAEHLRQGAVDLELVATDGGPADWPSLADMVHETADTGPPHAAGDIPFLLIYTSGTTGRPKGAVLTHRAVAWNALNATHMHDLTSADRVLISAPLFHVGGLNIQTLPALRRGAAVLLHRRFDPGALLHAITADRLSLTVLVPTQMRALIEHPDWWACDLSSLRMVTTGSTIVPHDLIHAFHDRGVPVVQVYGTTETGPIAAHLRAEQARDHVGSAGLPARHCEFRIVDADGVPVGDGECGEVQVRGPNVMTEYWRDPAATGAAFDGGWFRTGDIGHCDADGYLYIDDRIKDVIISGGENIYSVELEAVLADDSRIAEAAVVARRDDHWGEVPVAVVVPAGAPLDTETVIGLFEGRLARFKHPKAVAFVDALPRNAMGKVEKFALRELVAPTTP